MKKPAFAAVVLAFRPCAGQYRYRLLGRPLTVNAGCLYLERNLKDRLDWYKQNGFTAFGVWAEQVIAGAYLVYIGYT